MRTASIGNSGRPASSPANARRLPRSRDAGSEKFKPGDVIVLICRGPLGAGMEEIYQITSALRYLKWGKDVAVITDARFSRRFDRGLHRSRGAGGAGGRADWQAADGDLIQIVIDRNRLAGTIDFVGTATARLTPEEGAAVLAERPEPVTLQPTPISRRHATVGPLQQASGGTWGAVFTT